METETITPYWEYVYSIKMGEFSWSVLFKDYKYDVCKEVTIHLDNDGIPNSEELEYYFDGELQEFTEEQLIEEIKKRS